MGARSGLREQGQGREATERLLLERLSRTGFKDEGAQGRAGSPAGPRSSSQRPSLSSQPSQVSVTCATRNTKER